MTAAERVARLLPGGVPRNVRCYDNGGETADRFTVIFTGRYRSRTAGEGVGIGASADPYYPLGVGMTFTWRGPAPDVIGNAWGGPALGRRCHLGKRVSFESLPPDVRRFALEIYRSIWALPAEAE